MLGPMSAGEAMTRWTQKSKGNGKGHGGAYVRQSLPIPPLTFHLAVLPGGKKRKGKGGGATSRGFDPYMPEPAPKRRQFRPRAHNSGKGNKNSGKGGSNFLRQLSEALANN